MDTPKDFVVLTMKNCLLALVVLAIASASVFASDPAPLQDFLLFVKGKVFKDPKLVTADVFFSTVIKYTGNASNALGSKAMHAFIDQFPGLNTFGMATASIDFAPYAPNPPHIHSRASEILVVVEDELYLGFVTSNQLNNTLFAKVLKKRDVHVFPQGKIHFQLNVGKTSAAAFAFLGCPDPGAFTVTNSIFSVNPPNFCRSSQEGLPSGQE